jgi:hypothetical protein
MRAAVLRSSWQLPLQWPRAAAHAPAAAGLVKAAIVLALLSLTVLDRFGLMLNAEYAFPPALLAMHALAAAILLSGAGGIDARGALAFLAVASVASLSFLANALLEPRGTVSFHSLALLFAVYAPFAVTLRADAVDPGLWLRTLRLYIGFSLLLAAAGIAQFFLQFLLRPEWLFNYAPLIPEPLRASGGWNTASPVGGWLKSNGFFLREPSIFSIAMAFGLLAELGLERPRRWALAALAAALTLSYSGSGLACVAVAMLFPLGWRTLARLAACLAAAAAIFLAFGEALNLSHTLERVDELNSERTSAYCRFVYPGAMTLQQVEAHPWTSLLGNGPGTMVRMGATCADGHQTTYAKLAFEYGLAGVAAFGFLIVGALHRAPLRLGVAAGLAWLLLGGNLLASEILLFIYLVSAMWPRRQRT